MRTPKFLLPVLACFGLLFAGCPYQSDVAIDAKPTVKLDQALVGNWEEGGSNEYTYTVTKLDDYTCKIIKKRATENTEEAIYNGFISQVGNAKFLNLWEDSEYEKKYYLYKMELNGNSMKLLEVTDNIKEKFEKSEDLKAFITKHMNLSFFYNGDEKKFVKF